MLHSRLSRVNELLKKELGEILDNEIENPKIPPFVTVHTVKVTKDLRSAFVSVTLLQDDDKMVVKEAIEELNRSAGYIRAALSRRVVLRYVPNLHFEYNPSTRYAAHMEEIFHKIEPADGYGEHEDEGDKE